MLSRGRKLNFLLYERNGICKSTGNWSCKFWRPKTFLFSEWEERSPCFFVGLLEKNSIEFLKILGCILYYCLKINISAAIKLNCNNYKQINIRWWWTIISKCRKIRSFYFHIPYKSTYKFVNAIDLYYTV